MDSNADRATVAMVIAICVPMIGIWLALATLALASIMGAL